MPSLTMTVHELITALGRFDRDLPVRADVGDGRPLQPVSNPQGGDELVILWCNEEGE